MEFEAQFTDSLNLRIIKATSNAAKITSGGCLVPNIRWHVPRPQDVLRTIELPAC